MAKLTKRSKQASALVDRNTQYGLDEAVSLLKQTATAKFDETIELAFNLNVDPT